MKNKTKICFVGNLSSTFIKIDYEILKKKFDVDVIEPPKTKKEWPFFLFSLFKKIKCCDLVFSWFAGPHAAFAVFLSKIYRKKSIVVAGGYDAAYVPEINYGAFTNLKERIPAKYALKNADLVLAVSEFIRDEIMFNMILWGSAPKWLKVLHTGYDYMKFKSGMAKRNIVLTVANCNSSMRTKLKGIHTFINAAKLLPSMTFIIIGISETALKDLEMAPSNVKFIHRLPQDKLIPFYQSAKVYCQLSMREGLPNTCCEAMLCECIPVGTDVEGIQKAIGNTGLYVPYDDEKATAKAIQKALTGYSGKDARERIKKNFPLKKREDQLEKIITKL